jgi:hypothetical protein
LNIVIYTVSLYKGSWGAVSKQEIAFSETCLQEPYRDKQSNLDLKTTILNKNGCDVAGILSHCFVARLWHCLATLQPFVFKNFRCRRGEKTMGEEAMYAKDVD